MMDKAMEAVAAFAPIVREFLVNIVQNEIIPGENYNERIEISDGGYNSYIGLCVDIDDYNKSRKMNLKEIRIFRHSNSASKLLLGWEFQLGDICNPYCDNYEIPICFRTHGKNVIFAEKEAQTYFDEMLRIVRKSTAAKKILAAESAEKEKAELLARLSQLEELHPLEDRIND